MKRKMIIFSALLLTGLLSNAQSIELKSGFVEDSLKIGMEVHYYVTAKYPPQMDLILPDSSAKIPGYELIATYYTPTILREEQAFDSVVYHLASFEIAPVQYLTLPARVARGKDTLTMRTPMDSIFLVELVAAASDTTALKQNTSFIDVPATFNTPLLAYISLGILLLLLLLLAIFGKRMKRYLFLRKLRKQHLHFTGEMERWIQALKKEGTPETAEKALHQWKSYLEKLERLPYTKLTTKEIMQYDKASELEHVLRAVDRCVYGKIPSDKLYQDVQHLEGYAINRYNEKVEEVKDGK
jgi:hypothetical protein